MWLWKSRNPVRSHTARPTVILPTAGGPVMQTRCTGPSAEDGQVADVLGHGEVLGHRDDDEEHEHGAERGPHEVAHPLPPEHHDGAGADEAGDQATEVRLPRD